MVVSSVKSVERRPNVSGEETALEVTRAADRPGVYKLLMARIFKINNEMTNFRMYGSKPVKRLKSCFYLYGRFAGV